MQKSPNCWVYFRVALRQTTCSCRLLARAHRPLCLGRHVGVTMRLPQRAAVAVAPLHLGVLRLGNAPEPGYCSSIPARGHVARMGAAVRMEPDAPAQPGCLCRLQQEQLHGCSAPADAGRGPASQTMRLTALMNCSSPDAESLPPRKQPPPRLPWSRSHAATPEFACRHRCDATPHQDL